MPFPLAFEGLTIPGLRALGYVIASDLAAGGGTVRPDAPTIAWVVDLLGSLAPDERRDLLYTLLAYRSPATVGLGAQLVDVAVPELAWLVVAALKVHDLGLLLAPAPEGGTLEGLLATVAARHADLSAEEPRQLVLTALRSAGLPVEEARVLVRWADADEVLRWGDDLLAEGDPEVAAILEGGLARGEIAIAILKLFPDL
ncbi:MAG: hypothetical protein KC656_19330 [Myxococcales bacterium]|nr:hypothetical protein [Myxococcales bacterium]MCB9694657.1 hypothetical protein [Alphaproteobacteria bacterium]